jgi:serine/threonine protein kinase
MPEKQFGPYRLVHQIAVGGMAEIHLAKTKGIAGFEKFVALKMIHPNFSQDQQFIEMLIDEAKLTVQLQHVNIAQTFDLGRVDDTYYITMEYVDGADLYKLLRKGSEMEIDTPVEVAAFIAKEVSNGLDYAHRKRDLDGRSLGIVHRDVSPQNVLISHSGEVKLVDFGIAKATMRARQTAVGVIKGKYYYMSPEQAWGEPLDHRTDVFSTGILLYEMLTGQMLYLEEDLHKLLDMVRKANIAPPSTLRSPIPPQLEKIVMRALAGDRDDRYQTAADLATDLERFLHAYAPVFTPTKTVGWMSSILGERQPIAPEPKKTGEVDRRRQTKQISRDQLFLDGSEFTDENSVIFDVADLDRAREAMLKAEREKTGSVDNDLARAETSIADSVDVEDDDHATFEPDVEPALVRDRPPHALTRQITGADLSGFDDAQERTVISGPPVMERAPARPRPPRIAAPPPLSSHPPVRLETEPTAVNDPIGEREGEPTIPESELTIPEAEPMRRPPGVEPSPLGDIEATAVDAQPTRPGKPRSAEDSRSDNRDFAGRSGQSPAKSDNKDWEAVPALAASNPKPAVSSIRQPRASRRTPPLGVPAEGQGTGSVLSEILQPAGRMPRIAMAPAGNNGAAIASRGQASAAAAGSAGRGAPPADPVAAARPRQPRPQDAQRISSELQVAPNSAPTLPGPGGPPPHSGAFPGANPALLNTSARFAAVEVDDIPDRYKLARSSNKMLWIWIGAVAVVIAVVTVLATVLGGGDEDETGGVARIDIVSIPAGAAAFVDGEKLEGETPTVLRNAVPGKTYIIAVELPRHQRFEFETRVPEGEDFTKVTATLERIPVSLNVETTPGDAEVFLNGKSMGQTPLYLPNLDPETATELQLKKRGFVPIRRSLDWSIDTEKNVRYELKK